MKLNKAVFFGLAASISAWIAAQAGDLPNYKSAPVEYVRVCDAFGSGFFYLPGTETCLKVGGLVLAEYRAFSPSFSIPGHAFYGNGVARPAAGYVPSPSLYSNARSRDAYGFGALGRIELDARTKSEWGTVRTFLRVDAYYGSSGSATAGSGGQIPNTWNLTAGTTAPKETTIVNKAFIQFAGLTAGRAQSFFDFYADAYNFAGLRGSNATVALLAYTATFGDGWSATLSLEDQPSRRAAIGSTIAGFQAQPAGTRVPDIVGNLRLDEAWGAIQLSAAAHQVRASLYASSALSVPPTSYAFPDKTANEYGFAVQGGFQLNADSISAGDKLWLQMAYERGAFSYIGGYNLISSYGAVSQNRYMGSGFTSLDYTSGWSPQINSDCVFTGTGSCEQQWGWAFVGAYKHYWLPTLSSAVFGSYEETHYSGNALSGYGGAIGVANLKEARIGTNLIWSPLRGFDIGSEFIYIHVNQTRPVGLATDQVLVAAGLPAFKNNDSLYQARIRVQRAF
ncbi:porin [Beijerinckia mobilis]|uniref:porin n=1 Tax=Beijerinckia mobilis TaxID=231434 RepID=UPI000558E1D6|nr:porin [Beijerinckia mobilis]